ncbi:MAG: VOC family protein [Sporichthyaceae bacterium]|nr:VOC family protein [Sporichthyaceae bacterium]
MRRAEEAIQLYTSLFKNSGILSLQRYGPGEGEPEGAVKHAVFTLDGQEYMAIDSGREHAFTFTPAVSIFVTCESEAEVDRLYATLSDGGAVLMELGDYGFSTKFGWVNDRFGVSWQLNLP